MKIHKKFWKSSAFWWTLGWLELTLATFLFLAPLPAHSSLLFPHADKGVHFFIHFLLAGHFSALSSSPFKVYALLLLYGFGIELLQDQSSYRSLEKLDLLCNALGSTLGCLLEKQIRKFMKQEDSFLFDQASEPCSSTTNSDSSPPPH